MNPSNAEIGNFQAELDWDQLFTDPPMPNPVVSCYTENCGHPERSPPSLFCQDPLIDTPVGFDAAETLIRASIHAPTSLSVSPFLSAGIGNGEGPALASDPRASTVSVNHPRTMDD